TLFALYVDGAGGDGIPADFQQVVAAGNKRRVFARFDRAALIAALGDSTVANLRVAGQLQSGQYIYGEDTIRIVKARRRLPQAPRGQGSTTQRAPRRSVR
ncbi:MAG: hypothetical protein KAT00_15050, partial [Planctomycetes bacterium]|nr:hypothetical protein [Planctomycetota bacterium]